MLLSCQKVTKAFGDRKVLQGVSFDIAEGEHIGLVGRNGAGKTTLANIIFGQMNPDSGQAVHLFPALSIGYLLQSASYSLNRPDTVDFGDGADDFLKVAGHLGLRKIQEWDSGRFAGMSGGERTKMALAQVWASQPDLLILDEPTNHMDFQGVEWLISELAHFGGAVIIISHDRYFMDRAVTRIIELDDGVAMDYSGNYSDYRDEKARRRESQMNQYLAEKRQQQKIEAEIGRVRNWASKAHNGARETARKTGNLFGGKEFYRAKAKKMDRQVKSKIKRLERMKTEGTARPKDDPLVIFGFDCPEKRGRRMIEACDIAKGFGEMQLFKESSFFVQRGDRVALVGPNGCGKTTLVRAILGELTIDEGQLWISPSARPAYLSQDVMDLDGKQSAMTLLFCMSGERKERARNLLANIGITDEMVRRPMGQLSLGERTRVKLAFLIVQDHDLLVLDEPTNHLDLPSREKLEETLCDYTGTLLVVSHDRYLLDRVCDKLLVFEDGKIRRVEKRFSEFCAPRDVTCDAGLDNKDLLMSIELRLAQVLGALSRLTPGDSQYSVLDQEFNELVQQKKRLGTPHP